MKKEVLYTVPSAYRAPMEIEGFRFGEGEKAMAVVGSCRGNEVQQMYVAARLVEALKRLEKNGRLLPGQEILVVPCLNSASMNIKKRFWPLDNTDINRMYPGYDLGETTQRVADGVFRQLQGYAFGVQLTSFYQSGAFLPHVKLMDCGYTDPALMMDFGLRYGLIRRPRSYDTTTLNYNWQIWNTKAFSLYSTGTESLNEDAAEECVNAVLRFMAAHGILEPSVTEGYVTQLIDEEHICQLSAPTGGLLLPRVKVGQYVRPGDVLAQILDPLDCSIRQEVTTLHAGVIFYIHDDPRLIEHAVMFKIILTEQG